MKTLQMSVESAKQLYTTASAEFKTMLEQTFTAEELSSDPMECIHSYEDACRWLGVEPLDSVALKSHGFRQDEIDRRKLETITAAFNRDEEPLDWTNFEQSKWYPWFRVRLAGGNAYYGTGAGAFCTNAGNASANAGTNVSSPLCFARKNHAICAGKRFEDLYNSIIFPKR